MSTTKRLKLGLVGGGPGSFIGAIHLNGALMDGMFELVCGAFSSDPAKSTKLIFAFRSVSFVVSNIETFSFSSIKKYFILLFFNEILILLYLSC